MDVHKEGTGHLYPFLGEERGKKLQRHLTNFLLEQYYRHFRVFGCTSFVHIPAQLREKLSPRKPLVSFLDMLSPGIDAMKNEGALLHFHDMGKDHGMRKRKKRCKVRRYREVE